MLTKFKVITWDVFIIIENGNHMLMAKLMFYTL